jgi:Flp pilus assembly protein TadG
VHGTAAVEFAFFVPALVLMIVGTIDLGMGIYRKMQVQDAAQAGAQYAIAHGLTSAIANAVTSATNFGVSASPAPAQFCGCPSNTGVAVASCNSICDSGGTAGTYVTVSSQGIYSTLLPYPVIPSTFIFTAQSTVRIQ